MLRRKYLRDAVKVCVVAPGVPHAVPRTLAFARHFDEVHFIDVSGTVDAEDLKSQGIQYYSRNDVTPGIRGSRWITMLFERIVPDVIIVHFCSGPHFFSAIAYGKCPVAGIVMGSDVLYEHGDKTVPPLRRLLIRQGVSSLAYISAKADILATRCREFGATSDIAVNYWGADTRIFAPAARQQARESLKLPTERPLVLSPRTLSPLYCIDVIVDAMSEVRRHVPQALLVIIGKEVPEYRARLDRQIERLGLRDHVFFAGAVSYVDVPTWYAAADLVVSMARTDGFPNTVLEVMCCRRPAVVGRIPQIEAVLADGQDCRLVDIESGSLAGGICELLEDPGIADELAERGYRKALEIADIEKNGATFAEDINRCYASGGAISTGRWLLFRVFFLFYAIHRKIARHW